MWPLLLLAMASATPASGPTPLAATTVVARLQERYDRTADFTAHVVQEMRIASLGRTISTRGSVYFKRPGRMRWELANHEREIIVADGKTLWVYQPDRQQAFKAALADAFRSTTPISFLTGIGRIRTEFDAAIDGETDEVIYLRLHPRSATEVGWLRLGIDRTTFDIVEAEVADPMGNRTRLWFSNIKRDVGLGDHLFRFVPPADTLVVEAPAGF